MKKTRFLTILILMGFTSCIPYKEIDIQYLKSSELNLSGDFNKPIILMNLYLKKRSTIKEKFDYSIDSVASEEAALSLKENLYQSPWFQDTNIPIIRYQRSDSSKYIKPLSWSVVKGIASYDTADLVLSLEYMKIIESADSYRMQNSESGYYYGYLKAPVYCYWRIYDLSKNQIPNGNLYKDTLFWDAKDYVPVLVGNQIPGYFEASAYAGRECGEKYAKKIAPTWIDAKRKYFHIGSPEMEKGMEFVAKEQWIEAAAQWQRIFKSNKRKLCAKAAFNLALANEMLGKFNISKEWLRKAKVYYPLLEIDEYLINLEERINNNLK
jgi:hypothetical protein